MVWAFWCFSCSRSRGLFGLFTASRAAPCSTPSPPPPIAPRCPPMPAGRLAGAGSPRGADRRGAGGAGRRRYRTTTAGPQRARRGRVRTGRRGHRQAAAAFCSNSLLSGATPTPLPANAGRTAGGAIQGAMPGSPARPRPSDLSPPVPRPPPPPPAPLPSLRRPQTAATVAEVGAVSGPPGLRIRRIGPGGGSGALVDR